MKRWLAAAVVALALAGCRERPKPVQKVDDNTPSRGGTLLRRLEVDVTSLNPIIATTTYDRYVGNYLFSPLVNFDDEMRVIPALADAWTVSSDGREYTFKLNPKATFSDGTPVRASDVIFTLRKILDPAAEAVQLASTFDQADLTKSRVVDDHTVIISFREGLASQLSQFNGLLVLPEHVYGRGNFRQDFNNDAVGSGPYKLVRRIPGKEIVVQRRNDYWSAQPFVDTVAIKVITNETTAWNAVQRGDIDETMLHSEIWMRERNNPVLQRKLNFLQFYRLSYNYIAWNERNPLFADKRLRTALSMCLDVPSINKNLWAGTARAVNGHFLPDQWAYNPEVTMVPFDLNGAKQIFTSAGWLDTNNDGIIDKDGKPFKFDLIILAGSAQSLAIGQLYQAALKSVGVDAEISIVDGAAGIGRIIAGNYDAAYLSWDLDPDPDPYQLFESTQTPPRGQNIVFYANPDADKLIDQARHEMDMGKRADLYKQLQVMLAGDQPYTWVNQPSIKWAMNRRIHDVRLGKGEGLFGWYPGEFAWWLGPAASPSAASARRCSRTSSAAFSTRSSHSSASPSRRSR
ncbi:MAG TPA: ABC transporter substrate-binding protein [Thermoanaerobaculia bacterium]|nr:ABC transporter substrate-binding protein [Thermoanaerobaculia bacterium]